jgi:histidinol phosphatase-like PHP family hydrolase
MYLSDYHVHSEKSFDCKQPASIAEILKKSAELNLNQVALCDHYDVNWVLDGSNPKIDFKDSREQINQAKRIINCGTEFLLGVELGQHHQ